MEKTNYELQRIEFKQKKIKFLEKITQHEIAIGKLYKQVDESRLRTKNGQYKCCSCDCISLKEKENPSQKGILYECEICGETSLNTGM